MKRVFASLFSSLRSWINSMASIEASAAVDLSADVCDDSCGQCRLFMLDETIRSATDAFGQFRFPGGPRVRLGSVSLLAVQIAATFSITFSKVQAGDDSPTRGSRSFVHLALCITRWIIGCGLMPRG